MKPTLAGATEHHATNSSIDMFMQVRKLIINAGPSPRLPVTELELTASHTSDLNHLDPFCRDCRRLRAQLASIAESALTHIAGMQPEIGFKIHTDPGIVCSPVNGQRPSVTVSIYIWNRPEVSTTDHASSAVSQVQRALIALGVRSR